MKKKSEKKLRRAVRIMKIPAGEAPLWVREAWVGLVLPADPIAGPADTRGVISGKSAGRPWGVSVPQAPALTILRRTHPRAASWWKSKGYPQRNGYFNFDIDEVEIIRGVKGMKLTIITEEMMGNPWR